MRYDVKEAIATRRDSFIDMDNELVPQDWKVMYSFDEDKGPEAHAEQILSAAVAKALDRFETKETEKIVREYEFVDQRDTDGSEESGASAAEDDDYEFV
jgi:hypothetical protein